MADPNAPEPVGTVGFQGHTSEASIDQANIAMRAMPWYQEMLRGWGQDPGHPTLKLWQSRALTKAAQANGFVVDQGNIEMDDHGNFNPIGHKLRNTLIVAGLAAATIATMGAAGAFSGAAAGGMAGAGAGGGAAAAGTTAGTLAGIEGGAAGLTAAGAAGLGAATAVPALAGGAAVGAGAAGAAGGLASIEGGAAGLTSAGASGLGAATAVPALGGAGAAVPAMANAASGASDYASTASDWQGPMNQATGGPSATDRILDGANRAAPIINGISQAVQHGREAEADATQAQDRNENTRYANSIQAANVNLGAADRRASASVHGDILANAQPLRLTGGTQMVGNTPVPQTSGGLSPDVFSSNTRQLGKTISEQQLADQQANGGKAVLPQDPLTPLPNANGTGSKILTAAGYIAPLLGAINYGRR